MQRWTTITTDYGMLFILLLLVAALSFLTWEQHDPVGRDAGQQVADQILGSGSAGLQVLVVAESTATDTAFAEQVRTVLEAGGAVVVGSSLGTPADARRTIEGLLADGRNVDVVAATGDAADWTVFDRFEQLRGIPRIRPVPYHWPTFAQIENLLSVANQTAVYAIIAIGMTMVIITGGIDLSVGSLVALSSVTAAVFLRDAAGGRDAGLVMMVAACCLAALVCAAAGFINGLMVTGFGVPSFISTLSMMLMAKGLALRMSAGESISQVPASYNHIGGGTFCGIPVPVLLMGALYIAAHLTMSHSIFGRYVYAVGGNSEAARLSGVDVKKVRLTVFTICGALAGLGGVVISSKLGTGDPKLGLMYELDVIAAVVVGGTSLQGGEGRVFGTLIGAFIIAVIKNGMNLMHVDSYDQQIVLGMVIMAAVVTDTFKRGTSAGVH